MYWALSSAVSLRTPFAGFILPGCGQYSTDARRFNLSESHYLRGYRLLREIQEI
jgi:hypothetical protein